jgi:acetolactate synthase-1/2/3 large subunit
VGVQVEDADRLPELVSRAFHVAVNGRPGPVVVAIPEDVLTDACTARPAAPFRRAVAAPSAAALRELEVLLGEAERPLLVLGGSGWNRQALAQMQAFAERHHLPVAAGFRCQDLFDNTHPNYVGDLGLGIDPALIGMVRNADLLVVAGERLGEASTKDTASSYSAADAEAGARSSRSRAARHGLSGRPADRGHDDRLRCSARRGGSWPKQRSEWIASGRAAYEKKITPRRTDLPLDIGEVVRYLRETLPDDAIITNGAGPIRAISIGTTPTDASRPSSHRPAGRWAMAPGGPGRQDRPPGPPSRLLRGRRLLSHGIA